MLSIHLLGSPQVLSDQRPLKIPRRKSRALLYYLAAQSGPLKRERLLAFFWPDTPRASAQQTLRTTLHGLRKTLGSALRVEDEVISLDPQSWVDVRVLEAQLSASPADIPQLSATLDLYRGPFLADFSLPDSIAFEDWLTVQREYYRRLEVRGLVALSQYYEARREYTAALDALERALAFDLLQEDLQRESIRLLYLAGDRPAAIRRYDQLRRLLDEEMGVPPMVETRALYDAILLDEEVRGGELALEALPPIRPVLLGSRSTLDTPSPAERLPFTGREVELESLRQGTAGHKLVVIEGEPGIGKTRLAEEYIGSLDALVLSGAARELEQALPYQPLIEALRGLVSLPYWPILQANLRSGLPAVWLAEASRLLPELRVTEALGPDTLQAADESRLWEGFSQFLAALGRGRPLVLFIDDLQWAGASTLGMLGYLVRQPSLAAVSFLAASRPVPPRSPLATLLNALTRANRLNRLSLNRLRPPDVTAISQELSPVDARPLSEWLQRNSEGNPYLLAELVRHAREIGLMQPDGRLDRNTLSASPVVPPSVYSLIQARLERLSEPARRILHAAVAAGRDFEFEIVARAAALSENVALDALDELQANGLVHPLDGTRYSFDHTLTMEVAYQEVGEPRHRLLHRRVGEAMISQYSRSHLESMAGVVAFHLSEGNAPKRAAPYAYRAGKRAAHLAAWSEAIAFYEQALAGVESARRFDILMALGEACTNAGQMAQASEVYRQALDLALRRGKPEQVDAARLALAGTLLGQSRYEEAIELARLVRTIGLTENALVAEFTWGTALSLEGADLEGAASHLMAAENLCRHDQIADPVYMSRIKFELGSVAAQQGDLPRANSLYKAALEIACQADQESTWPWCALAHNNLAFHLHLSGDPSALDYAQKGLKLAQEKGLLGQQPYLLSTLGEIALERRDLEQAEAYFNQGLALAERLGMGERIAGLTANLGLVALEEGRVSLAIHRLSTALARAEDLGTHHLAAQIRLWLVPLLPPDEGRAYLTAVRSFAESGGRQRLLDQVAQLESQFFPT